MKTLHDRISYVLNPAPKTFTVEQGGDLPECLEGQSITIVSCEMQDGEVIVPAIGPPNLRPAECCINCTHHQGWADSMYCGLYDRSTKAGFVCADFKADVRT